MWRASGGSPALFPVGTCSWCAIRWRPSKSRAAYTKRRFSLPYSVAVAAVDGTFGIESYAPQRLSDQRVLDVASRVDYEVLEYAEFPAAFPGRHPCRTW